MLLGLVVALLNLLGYACGWFHSVAFYDELVHATTSFWLSVGGWTLYRLQSRTTLPSPLAFAAQVAIALTAGLAWEFFQAGVSLIGSRADTLTNLAMDWAGSAAAGLLAVLDLRNCWLPGRDRQPRCSPSPAASTEFDRRHVPSGMVR